MLAPDQLRELEEAYLSEVPPDSISYLEQFRGTILRFYLAGHSKHSTFLFLKSRNLIRCSQASFYRWLTSNVDFNREVAEHLESERLRVGWKRRRRANANFACEIGTRCDSHRHSEREPKEEGCGGPKG
jgi:hypothetical protein